MNDMIVFAEDFGGLPSSTQHIVRQLAKRHRVLWVNSIGLRQPKWSLKDAKRLLTKLFAIALQKRHPFVENGGNGENSETFDEPNAVSSNIEIVSFLTIPAPSSRWARWLAKKMLTLQLQRKLKQLRMHDRSFGLHCQRPPIYSTVSRCFVRSIIVVMILRRWLAWIITR